MTKLQKALAAVGAGDVDALLAVIDQLQESDKMVVMKKALFCDDVMALRVLIRSGVDPNAKDYGVSILCKAAGAGALNCAKELVQLGADMRGIPVMHAVQSGNADLVEFLIQQGADPDAANPGFPTPLDAARVYGSPQIEELLLAHGATKRTTSEDRSEEGDQSEVRPRGGG